MSLLRFCAVVCACMAVSGLKALHTAAQQLVPSVRDPVSAFLSDAQDEAKRGTYVFYTQSYRDKRKQKVKLRGSVYGVLRDVKVNGCDVSATVQIFDLFSGSIRDMPTGREQDKTEYSIRFRLTPQLVTGMDLIEGRPSQLAHSMHTQCDDDSSCAFTWLRVRSPEAVLHEQIVLNHSTTFDGPVHQVLAPVSSRAAGEALIHDLEALAEAQCQ